MSDKPALEALEGGKDAPEPVSKLRDEKEIRKALAALRQRHVAVRAALQNLAAPRADWAEVARYSLDLQKIEAQIEVVLFALGEAETIR